MARKPVRLDEGQATASERLRKPYARVLVPESDGSYRAEILEFPGCFAVGESALEALSELEATAEDWVEAAIEMGTPIPAPFEETDYSGKLVLRFPKSLHRKAALAAQRDGTSLNQFIVSSLAEYVGQKSSEETGRVQLIHFQATYPTPDWLPNRATSVSNLLSHNLHIGVGKTHLLPQGLIADANS